MTISRFYRALGGKHSGALSLTYTRHSCPPSLSPSCTPPTSLCVHPFSAHKPFHGPYLQLLAILSPVAPSSECSRGNRECGVISSQWPGGDSISRPCQKPWVPAAAPPESMLTPALPTSDDNRKHTTCNCTVLYQLVSHEHDGEEYNESFP